MDSVPLLCSKSDLESSQEIKSKAKAFIFLFPVEPGRLRWRILRLQTCQNQVFEKEQRVSGRVDEG